MVRTERTAEEWFAEAARCYMELHQGCAWCGGSYRVYLRREAGRTKYFCSFCEFRAAHDETDDSYDFFPGEKRVGAATRVTMCAGDPKDVLVSHGQGTDS